MVPFLCSSSIFVGEIIGRGDSGIFECGSDMISYRGPSSEPLDAY